LSGSGTPGISCATIIPKSSRGSVDPRGQPSHRGLLQDLPVCASYTKVGPPLPNLEWGSDHIPIRMCFGYQFPATTSTTATPSTTSSLTASR
jgi:hypothetical protein